MRLYKINIIVLFAAIGSSVAPILSYIGPDEFKRMYDSLPRNITSESAEEKQLHTKLRVLSEIILTFTDKPSPMYQHRQLTNLDIKHLADRCDIFTSQEMANFLKDLYIYRGWVDNLKRYVEKDLSDSEFAYRIKKLEDEMRIRNIKEITTEASITAQPFFERQGYSVIKENAKEYRGIIFKNYSMSKQL